MYGFATCWWYVMKDANPQQPQVLLYYVPPQHRHPLTQDPRMQGPRRLPPNPTETHPAAGFTKIYCVLWPQRLLHLSRCVLVAVCKDSHPRARWSQNAARTAPVRRHPPAREMPFPLSHWAFTPSASTPPGAEEIRRDSKRQGNIIPLRFITGNVSQCQRDLL